MIERRSFQSVAWAWAAGWSLISLGFVISDVYSTPNRGLTAAYLLGVIGWAIGSVVTIRYVRQPFGAKGVPVALSAAGWALGGLVTIVLGLDWLENGRLAFLGPIVATGMGGAIGGALTAPTPPGSSPSTVLRQGIGGAFAWGTAFFVFQIVAFYAGYILMQMTVDALVPFVGHVGAKIPGWALPAACGGFMAARLAGRRQMTDERATAV